MRGRGWRRERMFTGIRGRGRKDEMGRELVVKDCRVQSNGLQDTRN